MVSSTQSLWEPMGQDLFASLGVDSARTVLSEQPKASLEPSGDQLGSASTVSDVMGTESAWQLAFGHVPDLDLPPHSPRRG